MENKEFEFSGLTLNGFVMLFANLAVIALAVICLIIGIEWLDSGDSFMGTLSIVACVILFITNLIWWAGFIQLEPGEARVMMFFGKYRGTFTRTGYYWVHPFITTKKLSLRARNLDAEPIKVNDKVGNPVLIGLVLVWKLSDTYKAMFEIDSQTMAQNPNATALGGDVKSIMNAFEQFGKTQSDGAPRQVAGQYAYDDVDGKTDELTLRSGGEEINQQLEQELQDRRASAGIEVVEARINYLAYAPEIAAVMLRRQQASAIITAREKIVEGAVSMVKMALDKLSEEQVVELDDDKKAAMVSNLMVVLCGEDSAQPVVNTGTLNH